MKKLTPLLLALALLIPTIARSDETFPRKFELMHFEEQQANGLDYVATRR